MYGGGGTIIDGFAVVVAVAEGVGIGFALG
jgi:hypothetical protein